MVRSLSAPNEPGRGGASSARDAPDAFEEALILGAGLAGLGAALESGAPIYEAADEVGGVAASDHVDGFTFDRGIHVLQTRDQRVLDLLDAANVTLRTHTRQAHIFSHGVYNAYPFQVNTAGLPLGLRARCVRDFLRRDQRAKPRNYEDWMNQSIGRTFADTFLIPYSQKFWTVHPREMTYEWTGNRVPQPSTWQVLRGALWNKRTAIGTNAKFQYPAGTDGYAAFPKQIAKQVGRILTGHRATAIDVEKRQIRFSNGRTVGYRRLISTLPLPELIKCCTAAPDNVRAAASRLRTNSILVVNLGVATPNLRPYHWVHFPEPDVSFFRISYPANFSADVCPPGTSSISAEVAFSDTSPIDRERIVERVIDDLIRVKALGQNDTVITRATSEIRYAYCIYDRHRRDALRTIHRWLAGVGIIPTGRYGLWAYFWSDQALMAGCRAGKKLARG